MAESKKDTIVTHNGNFHADEIFAVAVLSLALEKEGKEVAITRTREKEIIDLADYVVDVGGVNNSETNRFDHHQEGGAGKRENGIPYASFGLVWKEYGERLCGNREIVEKIDQILIQWIDASDNGVQLIETKIPGVYPYDIGLFFNAFTPSWKEGLSNIDNIFLEVLQYAKTIITKEISKQKDLLEVQNIIKEIYESSTDKRLIIMDKFYPSSEVLSKFTEPLFTIFPRDDGKWSLKSVRSDKFNFTNRKNLPENWAGKRDGDLEEITGVKGAEFCHNSRFLAVAKTKEAILKMAELALNS